MAGAFSAGLFSAMVSGKNAAILLTEDLNQGQQMEGITIVNPFL
jgi:predicted nucleic acid-binding protein